MQWLFDFIYRFFDNLLMFFKWLLEAIGEIISYVFYTIYDGLLTVIFQFFSAIDFSTVAFNLAGAYAGLPSQLIWLVNAIDLPQFFAYISGAIIIRVLINLIPAWATRA